MTDRELGRHLPLNPRVFAILAVLLEVPSHGYRIKQEVEARSAGAVKLDPGSLYRTIAKLLDDGVVEERPAPVAELDVDPRRRYYGVTALGRELAAAEAARLRALLDRPELRAVDLGGEGAG
jgi:DNA-binding PadR family transcriptional regulator